MRFVIGFLILFLSSGGHAATEGSTTRRYQLIAQWQKHIIKITPATDAEMAEVIEELSQDPEAEIVVAVSDKNDPLLKRIFKTAKNRLSTNKHGIIISLFPSATGSFTLFLSGHYLMATGVAGLNWAFEVIPSVFEETFERGLNKSGQTLKKGLRFANTFFNRTNEGDGLYFVGKLGGIAAYNTTKNLIIGTATGNFASVAATFAVPALDVLFNGFLSSQESLDLAVERIQNRGLITEKITKATPHVRNFFTGLGDLLSQAGFDGLSLVAKRIPEIGLLGLILTSDRIERATRKVTQKITLPLTRKNLSPCELSLVAAL